MQPSNVQDGEHSVLHDVCTDPHKELNKVEWIDDGLVLSWIGFFPQEDGLRRLKVQLSLSQIYSGV